MKLHSTFNIDSVGSSEQEIARIIELFAAEDITLYQTEDGLYSEELPYNAEFEMRKILSTLQNEGIMVSGTLVMLGDSDGAYHFGLSPEPEYIPADKAAMYVAGKKAEQRYRELALDYLTCNTGAEARMWKHAALNEAEWWLKGLFNIDPKPIFDELYWKVNAPQAQKSA